MQWEDVSTTVCLGDTEPNFVERYIWCRIVCLICKTWAVNVPYHSLHGCHKRVKASQFVFNSISRSKLWEANTKDAIKTLRDWPFVWNVPVIGGFPALRPSNIRGPWCICCRKSGIKLIPVTPDINKFHDQQKEIAVYHTTGVNNVIPFYDPASRMLMNYV